MSAAANASPSGSAQRGAYGAVSRWTILARMASLLLALGTSGLIFTYPQALAHTSHGLLSMVMLGVCAGFVHGVGFVPYARVWRILFSPWLAWSLMGIGLWLLANS